MLAQPGSDGDGGAARAADEQAFAAADQTAEEHSAAGSHSNFGQIPAVMAGAFELAFGIDVGAAAIGVDKRGVENETLSGWEHQLVGENCDGGLAFDTAGLSRLGHATFDGC